MWQSLSMQFDLRIWFTSDCEPSFKAECTVYTTSADAHVSYRTFSILHAPVSLHVYSTEDVLNANPQPWRYLSRAPNSSTLFSFRPEHSLTCRVTQTLAQNSDTFLRPPRPCHSHFLCKECSVFLYIISQILTSVQPTSGNFLPNAVKKLCLLVRPFYPDNVSCPPSPARPRTLVSKPTKYYFHHQQQ